MATELKKSKKSKKRDSELIESTDINMKNSTSHLEDSATQPKKKKSKTDKSLDSSKDSSDQPTLQDDENKNSQIQCESLEKKKKKKKSDSKVEDVPKLETSELGKKQNVEAVDVEKNGEKKKKKSDSKAEDIPIETSDLSLRKEVNVEAVDNQKNAEKKKKKKEKKSDPKVEDVPTETPDISPGKDENVEAVDNEKNAEKKKKKKKSEPKVEDVANIETPELNLGKEDSIKVTDNERNIKKKKNQKKKSDSKVEDVDNIETSNLTLGKEESIQVADNENNAEKKKKKIKLDSKSADPPRTSDLPSGKEENAIVVDSELKTENKKKKKKSDVKAEDAAKIETSDLPSGKEENVIVVDSELKTEKKKKKKKSDVKAEDVAKIETPDLPSGKEENVIVVDSELKTGKKKRKKKSDVTAEDVAKIETPDFLLGQKESEKVADSELDTLFKSSAFLPASVPDLQPAQNVTSSKPTVQNTETPPTRLPRTSTSSAKQPTLIVESDEQPDTGTSHEVRSALHKAQRFAQSLRAAPSTKTKSRASMSANDSLADETEQESDDDDDDDDNDDDDEDEDEDDEVAAAAADDDDSSVSNLVHETLLSQNTSDLNSHPRARKTRPTISNETPEERNLRTVFVGNVNIGCVKNRALARDLIDHLLNPDSESEPLAPRSRIESHRFRGIPLATPIVTRENQPENRSEKRTKTWRETQNLPQTDTSGRPSLDNPEGGRVGRRGAKTASDETGTVTLPEVEYLTPNQKRKVGYVTGDLHPEAKSCVAFLVISPPPESPQSDENGSLLSAQELAKLISEKSDATSFMGHVLRCDLAGTRRISQDTSGDAQIIDFGEQRRTVYIGGLDFMEHEDTVRQAVEAQLLAEKEGPPDDGGTWVERVRLVRDKGTAIGKGFGYVLLKSQDAVEEMLALESFKIGKRRVRVQKYVVPGKCSALRKLGQQIQTQSASNEKQEKPSKRVKLDLTRDVPAIYNGPDLSETLKSRTKDERKSIKMSTPARVERRVLKKQAKLKLKIAGQEVDRKIEAVKSKPLKRSINKPTGRTSKQQRRPDKKKA